MGSDRTLSGRMVDGVHDGCGDADDPDLAEFLGPDRIEPVRPADEHDLERGHVALTGIR